MATFRVKVADQHSGREAELRVEASDETEAARKAQDAGWLVASFASWSEVAEGPIGALSPREVQKLRRIIADGVFKGMVLWSGIVLLVLMVVALIRAAIEQAYDG